MSDPRIDNQWLAERVREVRDSVADLRREVAPLEYLQLGWRPPDGGWSIAQVVEHLLITDQSYIDAFESILARAPDRPVREVWRPSLLGRFLIRSQMPDSKPRMKTPVRWRPGPEPRANVVDEYVQLRERLIGLLAKADGYDLRRTRLSSPAARWIRINLGDAFMTLVVHTQRHLQQIRRIKARPEFPGG